MVRPSWRLGDKSHKPDVHRIQYLEFVHSLEALKLRVVWLKVE